MDALDRRFFRERYDAYRLLGGVAEDVRRSTSFDEAARQVIARIDKALHPESASLMVCKPGESAYRSAASVRAASPPVLSRRQPRRPRAGAGQASGKSARRDGMAPTAAAARRGGVPAARAGGMAVPGVVARDGDAGIPPARAEAIRGAVLARRPPAARGRDGQPRPAARPAGSRRVRRVFRVRRLLRPGRDPLRQRRWDARQVSLSADDRGALSVRPAPGPRRHGRRVRRRSTSS